MTPMPTRRQQGDQQVLEAGGDEVPHTLRVMGDAGHDAARAVAGVEGEGQGLQVVEDLDLEVVGDALTQPPEGPGARPVEDHGTEVSAQQAENDRGQEGDAVGRRDPGPGGRGGLERRPLGILCRRHPGGRNRNSLGRQLAAVDEDRRDDLVDEVSVQERRQEAHDGHGGGQQEAESGRLPVGSHVGEQAPEGFPLADAVGADLRARAQGPAATLAVLDPARRDRLGLLLVGGFHRLRHGRLHGLGHGRELEVIALGEAHELVGAVGHLQHERAAAHVAARLDAAHLLQGPAPHLGRAAVGAHHEKALVGQGEPVLPVAAVQIEVGRQQGEQQLARVEFTAEVGIENRRDRLEEVHRSAVSEAGGVGQGTAARCRGGGHGWPDSRGPEERSGLRRRALT